MPLVRRPGWLVGSAIAVAASSVRAEPTLEVTESGACPSRAEVIEALEARHLAAGSSGWKLGLRGRPGATVLRLENIAGDVVLERELRSIDCPAMAAAFALIVEAYFVEIGIIAAPSSAASAPAGLTPPSAAPAAGPTPGPAAVSAAPTAVRGESTRASASAARPEVFGAVGPELLLPSPVVTLAAAAGFGLAWPRLAARLRLLTALPNEIRVGRDRGLTLGEPGIARGGRQLRRSRAMGGCGSHRRSASGACTAGPPGSHVLVPGRRSGRRRPPAARKLLGRPGRPRMLPAASRGALFDQRRRYRAGPTVWLRPDLRHRLVRGVRLT